MNAVPSWIGLVVSDLERSTEWYTRTLRCDVDDHGPGWVCLSFPNQTIIELTAGDPTRPGLLNASYSMDSASPLIPGYSVEDPLLTAAGLQIVRRFPDWIVVVASDGLRVVLHRHHTDCGRGIIGFRYATPHTTAQRAFLSTLGSDDPVVDGSRPAVIPIILCDRCDTGKDPDGNQLQLVAQKTPGPRYP